jgi:PAS domain S-box-containing protein
LSANHEDQGAAGPGKRPDGCSAPGPELAAALDSLDTPVFVKDEDHRWVYLNEAACRVLGRGRDELLGGHDADFYDDGYARFLWEKDERVLTTGQPQHYEARVIWDGRPHHIVARKSLHVDPASGRRFVVGVIQDITDIRVTDLSLRASERRLRTIFESASVGVLVLRDGRPLFINPWVEALCGYSFAELCGRDLLDLVPPEGRETAGRLRRQLLETGAVPGQTMLPVRARTGASRWVGVSGVRIDWEGAPAHLLFAVDLTGLKLARDELALSEQRLRQVVDLVPHMIYARDAAGRYLLANRTMAEACGTSVRALTSPGAGPGPGHAGLAEVDRRVLSTGRPAGEAALEFEDASGARRVLRCAAMPFPTRDGARAVLGVCTDITLLSRTLERLERLNRTLLRFGSDPAGNTRALVALCGAMLDGACALYSRIEGDDLEVVAAWNPPEGFEFQDDARGHICTHVARQGDGAPMLIRDLHTSPFADSDPNVRRYGLRTYLGIPVAIGESRLGTLCVVFTRDERPGDEDHWLLGVVASAIAVEERRLAAMNALRRREGALRALFDAIPDQVVLLALDGTVQAVNSPAADALGRRPGEIIGRPLRSFRGGGPRPPDESVFARVRGTGGPVRYAEARAGRFFEGEALPVFDESGAVGGYALYSRDVTAERNAQRELVESEARFRATFEQSAVGMAHCGLDGRFLAANDRLCSILGCSREELAALRFQDVVLPGDLPANLLLRQAASSGELPGGSLEACHQRKDGRTVWTNVTVSRIQDEGGEHKYNFVVLEDITARREMEAALLRRDAVLEAVGVAAERLLREPDWRGSVATVLETFGVAAGASRAYLCRNVDGPDGRARMELHSEWSAPGAPPRPRDGDPRPTYEDPAMRELAAALAAKRPFHRVAGDLAPGEQARMRVQGILSLAVVPMFVGEQWWGFMGFDDCARGRRWTHAELEALMAAADILGNAIARRRVELAFRESERKLRIIAETVEEVFWITSPDRRSIIYLSPAFERLVGPREEFFREPAGFLARVHPRDRRRLAAHYGRPARGPREIEYRMLSPDGTERWIRERAFPVLDEAGEVEWLAGVSSDATLRREAEQETLRSLREKELLLQEVHHRVKNNLQIISSLLDMAGRRIEDHRAREIMRDTQSKIHSMAMIHLQLYGYERFDSIDIASYAQMLTWQLAHMYNAPAVKPRFALEEAFLPLSKAIPCGLVLSEALSNVFKHAFPGGRAGSVLVAVGPGEGGTVVLRVEDDGVGLARDAEAQGDSMGLKLMGNIVRYQLAGELDIASGDGGTRIRITFSRQDEGATA